MPAKKRPPLSEIAVKPAVIKKAARQRLAAESEGFYLSIAPMPWLLSAGKAGSRAAQVGALLWWVAGMNGHAVERLQIKSIQREKCNISRQDFSKGVLALEKAGLVKVDRRSGQASLITILVVVNEV